MKARYSKLKVALAAGERRIEVSAQIENRGSEAWGEEFGDALSYQVYDAASENLLEDGPRLPLAGRVDAGLSTDVNISVPLPAEPGRYLIFVSGLRGEQAWFFEQGSPFVLIEAEVRDGAARLLSHSVTTLSRLGLRRLLRAAGRAFVYPLRTIADNLPLIRSLVRRDILGRYRGSYGGLFWTVIHPLLMMLTYGFVFGVVLRTRFGDDGRPSNFVLYFLAGMLPWLALSEAVGRAPTILVEHANFVKKLVFPLDILPVNLVIAGLVSEAFGAAIFVTGMFVFGHEPTATVLLLPLLLAPQFLLTLGLCWFLAALGVFFRDLGQLIGFILTLWFFTTPICYPEASLPQNYLWLFDKNPMYILARGYRSIFLEASPPEWGPLIGLTAVSAAVFLVGYAWFYKLRKSFADLL